MAWTVTPCRYLDGVQRYPDVLTQRWYVHPNDLIGGWAVMNCDKPPSQADFRAYEVEVAAFVSEPAARRIAELHNTALDAGR